MTCMEEPVLKCNCNLIKRYGEHRDSNNYKIWEKLFPCPIHDWVAYQFAIHYWLFVPKQKSRCYNATNK